MAISAHLDESPKAAGDRARQPRRQLQLEVAGATESAGPANVLIHNISVTGLLLESRIALAVGEKIGIDLPEAGMTPAKVIWTSGALFGCEFDAPISPAVLSAAQLRSPGAGEVDLAGSGDLAGRAPFVEPRRDESFGIRMRRLRHARGLTMSQIASGLDVSKPTVWAWENGKARPTSHRIAALAAMLGVSEEELLSGNDTDALRELLARSREQISAAVGTKPDRIRILIEL